MRSGKKIPRYQGRSNGRSVIRLLMCCVISGLRGASERASGDEKEPLGCPIDRQCRSLLRAFRVSPLWGKMSNARTEANQGRLSSEGVSVSRVEIFSRREPKPDWGLEGRTERRKRATYPSKGYHFEKASNWAHQPDRLPIKAILRRAFPTAS